jgi:thiosulfate/3-mercaptopyruvate sulfurtransferase
MLISVEALHDRLSSDARAPSLLDVRWQLGGPAGIDEYSRGHIPGAVFVDLDVTLAAPAGPGGRHPLPDPEAFTAGMQAAGVSNDRTVVVYDAAASIAAARAWWLLAYFGHRDVAVLDGGFAAWVAAGYPVAAHDVVVPPGDFVAHPGGMPVLDADRAAGLAAAGGLLDARAPERFRGEQEPVDPVAGHIPGALNHPATDNVDGSGRFLDPGTLRARFEAAGVRDGVAVGAYCGSGVTAAHAVLALELAGYRAALYPGSWSEWITDPRRPVATGD